MEKVVMKKLLAALLFSTPLAVALPAAAKFQHFGTATPAAEKSDEDKMTPEKEKKEFQVSDGDQDKSKGDEEKKEFQVSDGDQDKSKGDEEKKEFQVSIDENDYDNLNRDKEKKEFQA
jgi:hypothetical protein